MYLLNCIVKTYARRGRGFLLTYYTTWETKEARDFYLFQ